MQAIERPAFETEASKHIYEYVERHGTAARHTVREVVALPPDQFREQLDRLKSKGYLDERGSTLRLGFDVGAVEEYTTGDVTYTIRPGRHADFDDLVDAIRDVTEDDAYAIAESVAEQLLYEETVTRHNTVESRMFFVATVDEGESQNGSEGSGGSSTRDDVVGWTHLDLPQVEKLRDTARQTVGVRETHRGHGIGSHLLKRGLDWAEANGYRKMYNSVPATNEDALAFLEAHDWNTEAIRKDHYTIDDQVVDEVMMAYTF